MRRFKLSTDRHFAEKLREMDVFTGVASGLAIAAGTPDVYEQLLSAPQH